MILTRQHYNALRSLSNQLHQELAAMVARPESEAAIQLKQEELVSLDAQLNHWLERATGGGYYQAIQVILKAMGFARDDLSPEEVRLVNVWLTQLEQEMNQLKLLLDQYLTLATVLEMDSELEPALRDAVTLARQFAGEIRPAQDRELLALIEQEANTPKERT